VIHALGDAVGVRPEGEAVGVADEGQSPRIARNLWLGTELLFEA
jgi:hypothetical protein